MSEAGDLTPFVAGRMMNLARRSRSRSMRAVCLALIGLAVVLILGCSSNNKEKLERTKWSSEETTIKGEVRKQGALLLEFVSEDSFVYRFTGPEGREEERKGKYTLKRDDYVVLEFEQPLAGRKYHTEKVSVAGDVLTMTDSDGTSVKFDRVR